MLKFEHVTHSSQHSKYANACLQTGLQNTRGVEHSLHCLFGGRVRVKVKHGNFVGKMGVAFVTFLHLSAMVCSLNTAKPTNTLDEVRFSHPSRYLLARVNRTPFVRVLEFSFGWRLCKNNSPYYSVCLLHKRSLNGRGRSCDWLNHPLIVILSMSHGHHSLRWSHPRPSWIHLSDR